jgi:hypothetical protein
LPVCTPAWPTWMEMHSRWNRHQYCTHTTSQQYHLLTCSMKQRPSSEFNRFSASQEIAPHFVRSEGSLPHSQVRTTGDKWVPC